MAQSRCERPRTYQLGERCAHKPGQWEGVYPRSRDEDGVVSEKNSHRQSLSCHRLNPPLYFCSLGSVVLPLPDKEVVFLSRINKQPEPINTLLSRFYFFPEYGIPHTKKPLFSKVINIYYKTQTAH